MPVAPIAHGCMPPHVFLHASARAEDFFAHIAMAQTPHGTLCALWASHHARLERLGQLLLYHCARPCQLHEAVAREQLHVVSVALSNDGVVGKVLPREVADRRHHLRKWRKHALITVLDSAGVVRSLRAQGQHTGMVHPFPRVEYCNPQNSSLNENLDACLCGFPLVVCPAAISGVRAADVTAGSIAPDGPSVHALLIPSCARAGGQ